MRKLIDALMARFGYVRASALEALSQPGSIPLKIEVDDSRVSESLALLERVVSTAREAEAAVRQLNVEAGVVRGAEKQFAPLYDPASRTIITPS